MTDFICSLKAGAPTTVETFPSGSQLPDLNQGYSTIQNDFFTRFLMIVTQTTDL